MENYIRQIPKTVRLRASAQSDLAHFFEHQRDAEANWMAAFTSGDPENRAKFDAHWARILEDPTTVNRTVLNGETVIGYVSSFVQFDEHEVSYWLDRRCWGQGIATCALTLFLKEYSVRPLYARAVEDNQGSRRVLEKCGFTLFGKDKGFANARGREVEELIFVLR